VSRMGKTSLRIVIPRLAVVDLVAPQGRPRSSRPTCSLIAE
jgi:hypothetical protein